MKLREGKQAEAKAAFAQALKRDPAAGEFLIAVAAAPPPTEKPCPGRGDLLIRSGMSGEPEQPRGRAPKPVWHSMRVQPAFRERPTGPSVFSRASPIETVVRLTANAPQSSVLAIIRARIFEQAGDMAQAEAEYAKALALRQDLDSLIEYGKFQCRNSQFEQAISSFEKALALDPRPARRPRLDRRGLYDHRQRRESSSARPDRGPGNPEQRPDAHLPGPGAPKAEPAPGGHPGSRSCPRRSRRAPALSTRPVPFSGGTQGRG